jgi:hypothetical protein
LGIEAHGLIEILHIDSDVIEPQAGNLSSLGSARLHQKSSNSNTCDKERQTSDDAAHSASFQLAVTNDPATPVIALGYFIAFGPGSKRDGELRELLRRDAVLTAPGAYNCITARTIEQAGFSAVYRTGAGTAAALKGIRGYDPAGECVTGGRRN